MLPPITEDTDYRQLAAAAGNKLRKANTMDDLRTKCENKVIDKYATAQ